MGGKRIIITTIQKFPYICNVISDVSDRNFAIIIDEAHSSQSGIASDKMNATMQKDAGMQLLLYTNGMWSNEGWVLKAEYEPALRAASDLFADYLARAVGGEKVKGDAVTRMMTMASEGLASALETLGDSSAAEAARQAHADDAVSSAPTGDRVTDAANTIKSQFDVKIFQLVLLVIAAVGVFGLIFSVVMIVQSMRK